MSKRAVAFTFFCFCCLMVDQLSKHVAIQQGAAVLNSGIAFGFLTGFSWLLLVVTIAVLTILILHYWHQQQSYPLALLVFGASSNLIDRLIYGGVIDWLVVPGLNLKNNLADWMVVVAIVWFLVIEFKKTRSEPK